MNRKAILEKIKTALSTEEKITTFFKNSPKSPTDEDIHSFAESNSIDAHAFEGKIYKILWKLLKSK